MLSWIQRNRPGSSGQKTEVQYLHPTERSGHDIAVTVNIDAGVPIESIDCPTHHISIERTGGHHSHTARVELSRYDSIPNKDFVLRFRRGCSNNSPSLLR